MSSSQSLVYSTREDVLRVAKLFGERRVDLNDLIAYLRVETGSTVNWWWVQATLLDAGYKEGDLS